MPINQTDTLPFDVLKAESDLAAALIGASYLDHCLGSTIRRRLKPSKVTDKILEPNGALGTFGSRIDLSYALGSFTERVHHDLHQIAKIRNLFVHHHLTLTFNDEDVVMHCKRLKYIAALEPENRSGIFRGALDHPRSLFVLTVVMLSQQLLVSGLGAKSLHEAT